MRPCPTGAPPSASCARESKRAAACHLAEPKEPRMRGLRMGKSGARRKRRDARPTGTRAFALLPAPRRPAFPPACSTCRARARRTGNGASKARFAGEMHAKPVTALRYERNRARALRDERDLPVRRDIPLRFEQRAPHAGPECSTLCTGPAKRAGGLRRPCETSRRLHRPCETSRSAEGCIGNGPYAPCLSGPFISFDTLSALCITSVTWG